MKKLFLIVLIGILGHQNGHAQGCVAIRSTGGAICSMSHMDSSSGKSWLFNLNNRYYKSYKHFIGTEEQKQREENGTNVINHSYTMDLYLAKNLNRFWTVAIDVPILANGRSSLYEHGGNAGGPDARHSTHSFGVGDIRFAVYKWLMDPYLHTKWNVQTGLGIKFPTGDYKYQDYFIKNDSTKVLGPVDQSIQLGDGGTGFSLEVNAFYNITKMWSLYGNFYYLANPREQNGVSTARGGTPSAGAKANGSDVMSVPDQYMWRAGFNFSANNFSASLGVRDECLPVHDLIGGSNGFRRPGYVISVEPGVNYRLNTVNLYAYVPVALVRNRTQSVPDKISSDKTGVNVHGDAAFADYVVNVGVSVRF
ncbi:MAG: hypothetical protein C5B52_06625 [Bacteroidetes bacterium]|nr:MAG: hypothetical protein C5B52_06625 [Bacteroidota bacterium]